MRDINASLVQISVIWGLSNPTVHSSPNNRGKSGEEYQSKEETFLLYSQPNREKKRRHLGLTSGPNCY